MADNIKKLLVLGGTYASYDVVKTAKKMGIYTIVADYFNEGIAKSIADECLTISTTDMEALYKVVKEKKIDGVYCGPSEFNIRNMIKLTEKAGLPCYTTMELWNHCANKDEFTAWCRKYGVSVPTEYYIHPDMTDDELCQIDYPIIIKPVDGSSSRGISVCRTKEDVSDAYNKAIAASVSKKIIAEKYIENGGEIFGVRYLVQNGEAYPYLLIDTYVVDPKSCLISGFTFTPSKYADYYLSEMDSNVRAMINGMGIKNGTVFFQALPLNGKIYFMEMGYRLSGGMIYKLTEPLMGINDMKMMIRFAVGGKCITSNEIDKIDLKCGGRYGAQLMVPLDEGIIGKIEGLDFVLNHVNVTDFIQYHSVDSIVKKENIGTLDQHFGRITIIADSIKEIENCVCDIQRELKIYNKNNKIMNNRAFDISRLETIVKET